MEEELEKLKAELVAERSKYFDLRTRFDSLVKALEYHDYSTCSCKMKMVPEVLKAKEHVRKFEFWEKTKSEVAQIRDDNRKLKT